MTFKKYSGFTLIELVLVIVLMGVIVSASMKPLMQGLDTLVKSKDLNLIDWQGNNALEEIARNVRTIMKSGNITTATATQFTFIDNSNATVSYTLSGNDILENSSVLVSNATALAFVYYTRAGATTTTLSAIRFVKVTITLALSGNTYSYSTTVNLQNVP
jgi:prepilin-type N-terminal cleavage/methylation domain-containing protein